MVEIGEPLENPDTVVFPIKDPIPRTKPATPEAPTPAPLKREPKKVPA